MAVVVGPVSLANPTVMLRSNRCCRADSHCSVGRARRGILPQDIRETGRRMNPFSRRAHCFIPTLTYLIAQTR